MREGEGGRERGREGGRRGREGERESERERERGGGGRKGEGGEREDQKMQILPSKEPASTSSPRTRTLVKLSPGAFVCVCVCVCVSPRVCVCLCVTAPHEHTLVKRSLGASLTQNRVGTRALCNSEKFKGTSLHPWNELHWNTFYWY